MPGELLSKYLIENLSQAQPEIKQEQQIVEELVFRNPFQTTEEIFEDAMPTVDSDKFYAISYIGSQGKGKSFSAANFATLAQEKDYLVIYGKAEDFVDLKYWISEAKRLIREHGIPKVCFVLDDMSYSNQTVSKKAAAEFKHFVADIRHVFKKELGTIQIFMIYISHRYHSVPPMLRNSASWIFASMLNEDRSDAMKLIPNQKEEKQKLESIYAFLSRVTQDGPKYKNLTFTMGGNEFTFRWGTEEDTGDGRLMMSFHRGELRIFNAKKLDGMLDLEKHRIIYNPPTEEEIKTKKDEEFRKKAEEVTSNLNNPDPLKFMEIIDDTANI